MKAYLMTIGDELLIGQVVDTNSAWMGQKLSECGVDIIEKLAVGDDLDSIVSGIEKGLKNADILLITGGLGPTKDDITKHALCKFFDSKLIFSDATYERIARFFEKLNRPLSASHKEQCFLPENAQLLKNRMGTAPGMLFRHDGKIIVSMPGVPYEMQAIMIDAVIPLITLEMGESAMYHKTLLTAGLGETDIEDAISPIVKSFPPHIGIAYLPSLANVRLRISGRGHEKDRIKQEVEEWVGKIKAKLGEVVFGEDDTNLEQTIKKIFDSMQLTLSTAESCTGGYIAHRITSVPGSSTYFKGSVVSYSNEVKRDLLHVNEEVLKNFGAVSEETVRLMVKGAIEVLKTDLSLAVSGIAGPDGGTEEKPVGTIWIGVGNSYNIQTFKIRGTKDRLKNIEYSANIALNKLRLFVMENYK